jgi:predicted permease
LRQAGRGRDGSGRSARNVLVVVEVALSVLLLVGATLLLRSLGRLQGEAPGFRAEGALVARVQFPRGRYPDAPATINMTMRLRERLQALPGVQEVGAINALPLIEGAGDTRLYAADRPPADANQWQTAQVRVVTPGYFGAMAIPLRSGRVIEESDNAGGEPVVVINEALAAQFFPGTDPVGRELVIGISEMIHLRVIGVVGDVRQFGLGSAPVPEFYLPQAGGPSGPGLTFVLRTAVPPATLIAAVRDAIREIDPEQPLARLEPLTAVLAGSTAGPRFRTGLLGGFAALALLLAALGVYGVMAYAVAQRRRELGIRLALGARPDVLVGRVVGQGMALAAAGVGLGLAGALGATRVLQSVLYGVGPRDGASFLVTAIVITAVVAAASWIPARRAARVDPLIALRDE